jgi:hypothetical protein
MPSNWHGNVKRNLVGLPNDRVAAVEAEEGGGVAASGGAVDLQTSGSKGDASQLMMMGRRRNGCDLRFHFDIENYLVLWCIMF